MNFFKSTYFRLILNLLVSAVFIIYGISLLSKPLATVFDAILMFLIAGCLLFYYFGEDFFPSVIHGLTEREASIHSKIWERPDNAFKALSYLCSILTIVLSVIYLFTYGYKSEPKNFLAYVCDFNLCYGVFIFSRIYRLALSRDWNILLIFMPIIQLATIFLVTPLIALPFYYLGSNFFVDLLRSVVIFIVPALLILFLMLIENGVDIVKASKSVTSSTVGSVDRGVEQAMKSVAYRFLDLNYIYGPVAIQYHTNVRITGGESVDIQFIIDYEFLGLQKLNTQNELDEVERAIPVAMEKKVQAINRAAHNKLQELTLTKDYYISVDIGSRRG